MAGYSEDLAYIHDAGYGDFARGAAPALLAALDAHGITSGLVVDLGCGSGIWAGRLLEAGYDVLGIDISPAMVRLARRKAPAAKFRIGSLLTAEIPPCAAVTSLGEAINYTFDPRHTRRTLAAFFRRVFAALDPGGTFIFDVAGPGQLPSRRRVWSLGTDWAVLIEAAENKGKRTLTRTMTIFRKKGKLYRRTEEVHVVRLYAPRELADELRRIGFRVRIARNYGAMPLRESATAIFATKPE
jgi:SAM-dependent methyltransferase